MKKADIVNEIIIAMEWVKENRELVSKKMVKEIDKALKKDIWYESMVNLRKALMRFTKEELFEVHHDVIEAIYNN